MKIAEGLPEADEQSQQYSQRLKRALDVVAKKFRIAENKTGSQIVVGVPGSRAAKAETEAQSDSGDGDETPIATRFHL